MEAIVALGCEGSRTRTMQIAERSTSEELGAGRELHRLDLEPRQHATEFIVEPTSCRSHPAHPPRPPSLSRWHSTTSRGRSSAHSRTTNCSSDP